MNGERTQTLNYQLLTGLKVVTYLILIPYLISICNSIISFTSKLAF